jgi:hypothetical protein
VLRRAQLTNLGSGAKMVAALREALGSDVHLPTSVLTGTKARLHASDLHANAQRGEGCTPAGRHAC